MDQQLSRIIIELFPTRKKPNIKRNMEADMSDDENDYYVALSQSKFVSQAPLHVAWPTCRNIPVEKLQQLRDQGHEITRGRFTRKEDRRLKKNWRRICRLYPEFADPFLAFGITNRPKSKEIPDRVKANYMLRKKFRYFKLKLRMAYKLDNRLVCDIYFRCKKIFAFKEFAYSSTKDLTEEHVDTVIKELYIERETTASVSARYNISPNVVGVIKRRPIKVVSFYWTPDDDLMLEMAIERQFDNMDPRKVPTYLIDWKDVSKEMRSCGYTLVPTQLYKRWHRLNPAMVGLRNRPMQDNLNNTTDSKSS